MNTSSTQKCSLLLLKYPLLIIYVTELLLPKALLCVITQPTVSTVGKKNATQSLICAFLFKEIENPLTQVRYLDKLVDELAKGRKMEKVLRG